MALWVPPSVNRELAATRAQHAAELSQQVHLRNKLAEWNRLLGEIDPRLMLVKAHDQTDISGLTPGYYHVIRDNPGAPPSIICHEGPNGEFREPDSGLLERLRKGDMWNDRAMKDATRRDQDLQRAAERQREQEREERVDEMVDRMKARFNPGTLIKEGLPR